MHEQSIACICMNNVYEQRAEICMNNLRKRTCNVIYEQINARTGKISLVQKIRAYEEMRLHFGSTLSSNPQIKTTRDRINQKAERQKVSDHELLHSFLRRTPIDRGSADQEPPEER